MSIHSKPALILPIAPSAITTRKHLCHKINFAAKPQPAHPTQSRADVEELMAETAAEWWCQQFRQATKQAKGTVDEAKLTAFKTAMKSGIKREITLNRSGYYMLFRYGEEDRHWGDDSYPILKRANIDPNAFFNPTSNNPAPFQLPRIAAMFIQDGIIKVDTLQQVGFIKILELSEAQKKVLRKQNIFESFINSIHALKRVLFGFD